MYANGAKEKLIGSNLKEGELFILHSVNKFNLDLYLQQELKKKKENGCQH